MKMHSKQEVDNYFTNNYWNLTQYAGKLITIMKRTYDTTVILSDTYCYILKMSESRKIDSFDAMSKDFIKKCIKWTNSKQNKQQHIQETQDLEAVDCICSDNQHSTLINETYITELINDFESTLSTMDKRIFDLCYHKGLTTKKSLAPHLGISETSAYASIKEYKQIEERLRAFIKNKIIYEN